MSRMNFHDELTPMQARVLFHLERVFRSAGGNGLAAHQTFLAMAPAIVDDVRRADTWTDVECALLLHAITAAATEHGMHYFRDVRC